ncbi:hypothetical protein VOLCADRAFT_86123 [Volvox carteri f. nagariensis]|uniref:Uncharacterized protein n=1 Tax=Volvox carteri f. nagariensis TaxID=3068 RepID=D8THX9_VOLCA|nr:uncharacterized protein VOLCADRAFT_86123 [Volvox carteri f. nagariensis]EFJ53143.1 hypothetical protein VOLCADRAFT_86123 [Volvox carteri f. nagariensis]|eukprot:XP_002946148.1 hypothetical protein VOLCADRAFT_86123 [Volvox carteri f. nagariensis]
MPRARPRQAGLALVSDLSEESFAEFLLKVSKKPKAGVEGIAELTRQQLLNVCTALALQVEKAVPAATDILAEGDIRAAEEAILILHGAAALALDLLTHSQQPPPEQLLDAAVILHDGVLITDMHPVLEKLQMEMQDAVMRLCCVWWERQLPGNESLVARTIPYALLRAIQSLDHNRTSMVHMCYIVRGALELLDFEDETIRDTKRLLLCAAMHPSFLREPEGRRFIAGLFKLEPQMTQELGAILRNQIPSGQRFALEAYGEILFRAWRDTVGPCAAVVEAELQGLMQAAILASTPALAGALRIVLNGLHSKRTLEKRLNPALVRLYDPILPRAFGAANAEVRRNAVHLLVAAFPIIDTDAPRDVNNVRLTQQLGFLMDGLADPCPFVREAAVEGCCRCLNFFWEIVPAPTSAKMISEMTCKLAYDGSSRVVRIAVLRGLCKLVDSQHAQPVLKKALPEISGLLQDRDPGVREALADLLVAVSGSRGLQFWGVVPPEELLEVIAVDKAPGVTRKISKMLVPSFFPNAQEGSARLGALLRSKPAAGLSFCRNMVARFYPRDPGVMGQASSSTEFTGSVPLEQILQFASQLAAHLLATAPRLGSSTTAAAAQQQTKRNGKAKAAKRQGKAGTKRAKKKAPAPPSSSSDGEGRGGEQQAATDAGADNGVAAAARNQTEDDEDVVLQECSAKELEEAVPGQTMMQLLKVAEEQLRKPQAVQLVLQMVASLHFTSGAKHVRATLFERLAAGTLPGCKAAAGDDETMELDGHRGPQGHDVGILSQMLKTLATGSNAPKLAALLAAALGVREPLPLRKPVASKKTAKAAAGDREGRSALDQLLGGSGGGMGLDGHGRNCDECDDDMICLGCKMLGSAGSEGRALLCGHPDCNAIIQAMQQLALAEADEIFRLAQTGAADEADSPAATQQDSDGAALLGDPWGALSRYCRAALHRAMAALYQQCNGGGGDGDDADDVNGMRTPASAGRKNRRSRSRLRNGSESGGEQPAPSKAAAEAEAETPGGGGAAAEAALSGFFEVVPVLELAMQACGRLTELVLAEPCVTAQLAALQYSQGLLRVLHVVHQTELLNISGQYVSTVSCLCNAQAVLAHTVLSGLADQPAGGSPQQQTCLAATLHVLLGLAQQMTDAVRSCGAAAAANCDDEGRSPSGRRTGAEVAASSEEGADADMGPGTTGEEREGELPPPGVAVEALLTSLMLLLCHGAVEPILKGPVRAGAAVLIAELLATTHRVSSSSWLGTLCRLAGQALASDPRVAVELQQVLLRPPRAQEAAEGDGGGEGDIADDRGADGEAAGGNGGEGAAAAVRPVRRRARGIGGQKKEATAAATAAAKALQDASAKVSELLLRESQAVGTVATVLVRVCVARKVHGRAMLLLARLAGKALIRAAAAGNSPGEEEPAKDAATGDVEAHGLMALGATALLTLCQAACPDAAAAPQQNHSRQLGPRARCGALAQEAAAQAARAEAEAAAKALDVLQRTVAAAAPPPQSQDKRAQAPELQPQDGSMGPQADNDRMGGGDDAAEAEAEAALVAAADLPIGLLQARLLARQLERRSCFEAARLIVIVV